MIVYRNTINIYRICALLHKKMLAPSLFAGRCQYFRLFLPATVHGLGRCRHSRFRSDLAAEQEIVHGEADPAERKDQDGDQDLADNAVLAGLEDVQHTPDGEDDAKDVDDFC